MKTLYIECAMGAAGDMLTAALYELLPDKDAFLRRLNALHEDISFVPETVTNCGITGTHMAVLVRGHEEHEHGDHHHGHDHSTLHGVSHILEHFGVPKALEVYEKIAAAEAKVHGVDVGLVHFHEVGALDAVADVAAFCLAVETLAPERIVVSPVHIGSGTVKCAHGVLPVPAPATAVLLSGVPAYGGEVVGELCTPTGAALLKTFAQEFGAMPAMTVEGTGYGFGTKDFSPRPNCVRAFLGSSASAHNFGDGVIEINCNLDDMTGEQLAFAAEEIFAAGALDCWAMPIFMKKGRPAQMLSALCRAADFDAVRAAFFKHTTTLGIRYSRRERATVARRVEVVDGVRLKYKAEYEDAAKLARDEGISFLQAQKKLS